ncbi:hypothetical protein NM688_g8071 [Phlebia brevispora]|uniref:Uncharacterized protein n=1 Tax=Phlebia brevispora TaxID=194682 RepID=A0ACC1RXV1_9APHY|nr:hypothetical protein NM688_g8071 [Phlebia brevispora]
MRNKDFLKMLMEDKRTSDSWSRWTGAIMSWEVMGNQDLEEMHEEFRRDRKRKAKSTAAKPKAPPTRTSARTRSQARKPAREEAPSQPKKKRKVDDDLVNDIRWADRLWRARSNLSTEDGEKYDAKDASIEAGACALETLASTSGTRLFCVNGILKNDRMYFWYYDACGFVYTDQSISLVEDFEKAAAILVGIACCDPERLGALPASIFEPPSDAPHPDHWPPESLKGYSMTIPKRQDVSREVNVTLENPIFAQYVLAGRRTFVYAIKKVSPSENEQIIKFSYQLNSRRQECDYVNIARKAGVKHLPTVHASGDLWKMSDGVRSIFYDRCNVEYEDRTLRAVIYDRYLPLETLIPDSPEYIPIMAYQLLDCLHDLRYKANILHRDVSAHNVMYERRGDRVNFVLIDFDMAMVVSENPAEAYIPTSKHRTGTLPFMAVELVFDAFHRMEDMTAFGPIPHRLCHDLESVYWLCYWCILVLLVPESAKQREFHLSIVHRWQTNEYRLIAGDKRMTRCEPLRSACIELPKKAKEAGLYMWFLQWSRVWAEFDAFMGPYRFEVADARDEGHEPPPFDDETINGIVTRDNIKKRLTEAIPDTYGSATEKAAETTAAANAADDIEKASVSKSGEPPANTARSRKNVSEDVSKSPQDETTKSEEGAGIEKKAKGKTTRKTAANRERTVATRKTAAVVKAAAKKTAAALDKAASAGTKDDSNDIRSRLRPRKQK